MLLLRNFNRSGIPAAIKIPSFRQQRDKTSTTGSRYSSIERQRHLYQQPNDVSCVQQKSLPPQIQTAADIVATNTTTGRHQWRRNEYRCHNNKQSFRIVLKSMIGDKIVRWNSTETRNSATHPPPNSRTTSTSTTTTSTNLVTMSIDAKGICTIVLNRPQKLNALNIPMFVQLQSILHTIIHQQQQPSPVVSIGTAIRVILVRGEGRAFCTGLDIPSIVNDSMNGLFQSKSTFDQLLQRHPLPEYITSQQQEQPQIENLNRAQDDDDPTTSAMTQPPLLNSEDDTDGDERVPDMSDAVQAIAKTTNLVQDIAYLWRQIHVPVIGCIHGMCYGGGLQMILGMDIRYVQTQTTKLSIMESKWGLIPDMGASITLRELIPIDIAKELTFTGRIITGEEAVRYGLVTQCVDDPIASGYQLALELVEKSPEVLRYSKELFQRTYRTGCSEDECLRLEHHYQTQLVLSYNQIVASIRTKLGWKSIPPYWTSSSSSSKSNSNGNR